ncbi:hypothetical protein [Novosphingobium sp. B1]|uniref:hypothetical protein n=1 Tax=Novosphingobium sp. B1 TaxID=1938756 RepID=UPI0009D8014F|nr:hypothetical protein [Novosphingobium sp. B1]SMC97202.1 hypothetical protein SAMN06272759_11518 [Novosphingobium sp. B1]
MGFVLIAAAVLTVPIIWGVLRAGNGARKFQKLGDIRGMPMKDIVARVGYPNSISVTAEGRLYQWIKTSGRSGYHYAILSDGKGNAVGYTHQFVR